MATIQFGDVRVAPWPTAAPVAVTVDGDRIRVGFADGVERRLHPSWLRDNCPCAGCRIAQTGEHRYFIGADAAPPVAVAATLDGTDIVVDWCEGHRSVFTPAWMHELLRWADRGRSEVETWAAGHRLPTFDHDELLASASLQVDLGRAFERHGALLVRGAPTRPGAVAVLSETLGAPIRVSPFDAIHDVRVDPAGYNVAHTAEALPPHNDFASYSWPPSGQMLHMLVNDAEGGDSIVVDGFHVLETLAARNPEHVDVLCRVPVAFRQWSDTIETFARQPCVRRDWSGRVVGLRFSNQTMQPIDPDHPDIDAFYEAYHHLCAAVIDTDNQVRFRMEAGDVLVVHGHRVLHARTAFDGGGARHLQDVYFDADDLLGRTALLAGER